jgi:hypothetical protein
LLLPIEKKMSAPKKDALGSFHLPPPLLPSAQPGSQSWLPQSLIPQPQQQQQQAWWLRKTRASNRGSNEAHRPPELPHGKTQTVLSLLQQSLSSVPDRSTKTKKINNPTPVDVFLQPHFSLFRNDPLASTKEFKKKCSDTTTTTTTTTSVLLNPHAPSFCHHESQIAAHVALACARLALCSSTS